MKSIMYKNPFSTFLNFLISRDDLSIEERGRRKLFVVFLMTLLIPLIPFVVYHFSAGNYQLGIADFLMAIFLVSMVFILRKLKNGKSVFRLTMLMVELLLLFWGVKGAFNGYSSLFAMSFPLFSFFLMGKREGLIWTLSLFCLYIIFFINPLNLEIIFNYPVHFSIRYTLTFTFIILFAYNYETVGQNYKKAITSEREKLLEERNLLKEAIEQLNYENKMRMNAQNELEKHKNHLEELISERTEEIQKKNIELQHSRDELKLSEQNYKLLADNITDIIWAVDLELNFIYISPSIESMFGYSVKEAMALRVEKLNTPASFKKLTQVYIEQLEIEKSDKINKNHYFVLELEQLKKDGTVFPVELTVSFIKNENDESVGFVGITRDISERRKYDKEKEIIQAQLSQAQKMEAIGTLVSGLAHDFNNILGGIIGSFNIIELLIKNENISNKDKIKKYISVGLESSNRSSNIIKQLLTLSKKHELTLVSLDINISLKHILTICKNSFPKSVILDFQITDTPYYIMAEPVQIEQVLLNLCINASHAMTIMKDGSVSEGGKLTVVSSIVHSSDIEPESIKDMPEIVKWVRIDVIDNGVGINPDTMQRIYEPFFTTKKQDEGTGLGLATSYSIIKQHRGFIKVTSKINKGSTFSVFLPCIEEMNKDKIAQQKYGSLLKGEGIILIIDDEEFIIDIASEILKECGYKVLTADNPFTGIDLYRENYEVISAVLLDLSMPGKSGIDVFNELKEINSDVKALLSSGMIDIEAKEKALKLGIKKVIHKPYVANELSKAIKEVLS